MHLSTKIRGRDFENPPCIYFWQSRPLGKIEYVIYEYSDRCSADMSNMNRREIFIVNSRLTAVYKTISAFRSTRTLANCRKDLRDSSRFVSYIAVVSGDRSCRNGLFNLPRDYEPRSRDCCHRNAISFVSEANTWFIIRSASLHAKMIPRHQLWPETYHKGAAIWRSSTCDSAARFIRRPSQPIYSPRNYRAAINGAGRGFFICAMHPFFISPDAAIGPPLADLKQTCKLYTRACREHIIISECADNTSDSH